MQGSSKDPLSLSGLDPDAIAASVEAKKVKPKPPPTEMDMKKEERLNAKEKRLSSGIAAAAGTPTPSAPVEAKREVDKSLLLDRLTGYRERFPHLKKRNNVTVKSSAEDIQDELHYCEMQLGSKNDGSMGAMILHGAVLAVETIHRDVWKPLGLNLNGLLLPK